MSAKLILNPYTANQFGDNPRMGVVRIRNAAGDGGRILTTHGVLRFTFSGMTMTTVCTQYTVGAVTRWMKATGDLNGVYDFDMALATGTCGFSRLAGPTVASAFSIHPTSTCATATDGSTLISMLSGADNTPATYYGKILFLVWAENVGISAIFYEALIDVCDLQEGVAVANLVTSPTGSYTSSANGLSYGKLAYGGTLTLTYFCEPP